MSFSELVHTCKRFHSIPSTKPANLHARMNQWCGINSLAYFLPITFERNIGLSTQLSLIISGILGTQYFLVSWLFVNTLLEVY